jgi:two-component system alkaline phosphatase synthesis response regulator PhoP
MAKTILIADDEPGVVKILGMRLMANGYNVIVAYDGASTIELARKAELDLIILDIKMPCTNGYSVFEDLKASAKTMLIPIVFFSALPPEQVREKAAQLGADGFISKSADPDEILAKVTEILGQFETQPVKQK